MAVKGAGSFPKMHFSVPKAPSFKTPPIKGPSVPKLALPGVPKVPSLESPALRSRRGIAPKLQLAKAAAGASATTGKRNPNYPTP